MCIKRQLNQLNQLLHEAIFFFTDRSELFKLTPYTIYPLSAKRFSPKNTILFIVTK